MKSSIFPMVAVLLSSTIVCAGQPVTAALNSCPVAPRMAISMTYPKIEVRFELPGLSGNPFDFAENDVVATFGREQTTTVIVPAFFDGGVTWRVRYTPTQPGAVRLLRVTRNGAVVQPQNLERAACVVSGQARPGFVRRDPKHPARFILGSGAVYYPLGHNVAWKSGDTPDIPEIFARMGAADENWSRVWMNHWDNKNLDWVMNQPLPLGTLSLDVARRWDAIVAAAETHGIYFQMVLQHHGQYSTRVNPNWGENPWNAKNGGFLATPGEFFTDPRARALTKSKLRYIIARWGYSPHVLAWELFNEVQFTDAVNNKREADVAAWHREMAAFLRAHDPYQHLITTSSDAGITGLYDAMDYVQPHAYPVDPVSAGGGLEPDAGGRPIFFGEIGPSGDLNADDGRFLHPVLWSSLMSASSGAAQYWTWDNIHRRDLYGHWKAASEFLKASGYLTARPGMRPVAATVTTPQSGSVSFGPGGGWGEAKRTAFTIPRSGTIEGLGDMPSFLQGNAHRAMFPGATFTVDYAQPGTFAVAVRQISKAGAHLKIAVDGAVVAERDFPAAAADTPVNAVVEAKVPAGRHTIRVENSGADWLVVERFTLAPYGPTLRALAKAGTDGALLWIYRTTPLDAARSGATQNADSGTVAIPGLLPGRYRVTWWDTRAGRVLPPSVATSAAATNAATVAAGKLLVLNVPTNFGEDVAAFALRAR